MPARLSAAASWALLWLLIANPACVRFGVNSQEPPEAQPPSGDASAEREPHDAARRDVVTPPLDLATDRPVGQLLDLVPDSPREPAFDLLADGPPLDLPAPDLAAPDLEIVFSYFWKTGSWGACSARCDGGTQSREVWCERSDGTTVSDALCSGAKPPSSQSCNTQPCCMTDVLQSGQRCDGNEQVQWVHFGSDTGSASDRTSCANTCTSWARGTLMQWCCMLYEDSSSGTNWVCRVYDSHSMYASSGLRYSGLGRCQSP